MSSGSNFLAYAVEPVLNETSIERYLQNKYYSENGPSIPWYKRTMYTGFRLQLAI